MSLPTKETVGLNTPFRNAAKIAFDSALSEIEKNWDGARSGKDVDAIHDLRVGTRRLRAALSIYEAVLPEAGLKRVERSVAILTDALGPARDADVLLEHLKSVADGYAKTDKNEADGVNALIENVKETRDREQDVLNKALKKFDVAQLKSDLTQPIPKAKGHSGK